MIGSRPVRYVVVLVELASSSFDEAVRPGERMLGEQMRRRLVRQRMALANTSAAFW